MNAAQTSSLTHLQLDRIRSTAPVKSGELLTEVESTDSARARRLSDRYLEAIPPVSIPAGTVIFREGERGESIYLIRRGCAAVVKGDFSNPVVLAHCGAGELIGEMAVLEDLPRSASVIALEPMSLVPIAREEFLRAVLISPFADVDMLRQFSHRLRRADEVVTSLYGCETRLNDRVDELTTANRELLELQKCRQETMDLVIHDLRNPLQGIVAALDLLAASLDAKTPSGSQKYITYIFANCNRLRHLVDSLIDISRMETGALKLSLGPTDLRELAAAVLNRATPSFESAQLKYACDFDPELPDVVCDLTMIERVISNLLDNAVKFTPPRGVVTISVSHHRDDVTVAVSDTGSGIPPSQRDHIFERFARGSSDDPLVSNGFGLGLTFCRLAVEAHNGRIWVESGADGIGSRFVFTLPVAGPFSNEKSESPRRQLNQ